MRWPLIIRRALLGRRSSHVLDVAGEAFEAALQSIHAGLDMPEDFVEFAQGALEMGESLLQTGYSGGEVFQVVRRWFVHEMPQITPAGGW